MIESKAINSQINSTAVAENENLSQAWLMSTSNGFDVAVGRQELRHLLIEPTIHRLPHAPKYCKHLVEWEDRLLPLYDLGAWLLESKNIYRPLEAKNNIKDLIYAVVGFNLGENRVEYGALAIVKPPALITVNDVDFEDLDESLFRKKAIIKSNFNYQGKSIPVINIKFIFTGVFSH